MQVSNPNNVKIYNLSAGKSLPEWLSDRKRRALQKQDVDVQKRIELIQNFEMPTVSHCVQVTNDGQYICATGTYKPRFRCYDVGQMSLKFERGLDSDVVKFQMLSDDYTKEEGKREKMRKEEKRSVLQRSNKDHSMVGAKIPLGSLVKKSQHFIVVFLQSDRYLELHSQFGRYHRMRIPKYGRDLAYHSPSCDLYIVGIGSEIYRINLEQGKFLNPISVDAAAVNCCEFNPEHYLFACGTGLGTVECFDPRVRKRVGVIDVALANHVEDLELKGVPAVTALTFRDSLNLAVGTSSGHVLLYDLRSNKPLLVKDHHYEMPIKAIRFQESLDLVLSMDTKILKLWNRETGKAYTSIEPGTNLTSLCLIPESGLFFMSNEAPKMLSYYIPALGTAPKWCSFLDNLTEELEENTSTTVYDDYKFVTRKELDDLGLTHLIGSNLLRAYMHGFFMDMRLYNKAKAIAEPFAYEEYRRNKIKEKIEQERSNRVRLKNLPKVNKEFAAKLMDIKEGNTAGDKKKSKKATSLLEDDRFGALFKDPEFHIDTSSAEYRLMNPVVSKIDKKRKVPEQFEQVKESDEELEGRPSDEDSSSSDDEHVWTNEVKKQHKLLKQEALQERRAERRADLEAAKPRFYELKEGQDVHSSVDKQRKKELKKSLAERLESSQDKSIIRESGTIGNKEMTFRWKKSKKESQRQLENKQHYEERKNLRRSAKELRTKGAPKYWMGQRVK